MRSRKDIQTQQGLVSLQGAGAQEIAFFVVFALSGGALRGRKESWKRAHLPRKLLAVCDRCIRTTPPQRESVDACEDHRRNGPAAAGRSQRVCRFDSYRHCRRSSQNHGGPCAIAAGSDEPHAQWYRGDEGDRRSAYDQDGTRRWRSRHGGHLWATSHDGRGATFHFTLPTAVVEVSAAI
jgi:hypothetical protein